MNEAFRFTKKGEVIYKLQRMLLDEYGQGSVYSSVDELLKKIENTVLDCRSFDVVEVIRCKDCRWYEDPYRKIFENCVRGGRTIPMQPTDYCSYGERRE